MFTDRLTANLASALSTSVQRNTVLSVILLMLALLPAALPAPANKVLERAQQEATSQLVTAQQGLPGVQQLRVWHRIGVPELLKDPPTNWAVLLAAHPYPPLILASATAFLLAAFVFCSLRPVAIRPDAARAPPRGLLSLKADAS